MNAIGENDIYLQVAEQAIEKIKKLRPDPVVVLSQSVSLQSSKHFRCIKTSKTFMTFFNAYQLGK